MEHILYAQWPSLLVLALVCFVGYLRRRKHAAVRATLWVLVFALMLAAALVCCILGIHAGLWTLATLFALGFWSWTGLGVLAVVALLLAVHGIEKRRAARQLKRAMQQAEEEKRLELARAREEGEALGRVQAESEAYFADEPKNNEE